MKIQNNDIISLTEKGKLLYGKTNFLNLGRYSALVKTLHNGGQQYFNLLRYKSDILQANLNNLIEKGYAVVSVATDTSKNTNEDLVKELQSINVNGKYDTVIQRAIAFNYHNFKSNHDWPKEVLINDLSLFYELSGLCNRIRAGEFDETL